MDDKFNKNNNKQFEQLKTLIKCVLMTIPGEISLQKFLRLYEAQTNSTIPYKSFGFANMEKFLLSMSDVIYTRYCQSRMNKRELLLQGKPDSHTSHVKNLVDHQKKETNCRKSSKLSRYRRPKENYLNINSCAVFQKSNPTQKYNQLQFSPNTDETNSSVEIAEKSVTIEYRSVPTIKKVPDYVKGNLMDLISCYPQGLTAEDIKDMYQKCCKSNRNDLTYNDYGWTSLDDMFCHLTDIFKVVECGTKRLFVSAVHPQECLKEIKSSIDEQVVGIGESFSKISLSECRKYVNGQPVFHVKVGLIETPDLFWLIFNKDDGLHHLLSELQNFYLKNAKKYRMPISKIRTGQCVVAKHPSGFYRGVVVNYSTDVEIFSVDDGSKFTVPVEDVMYLHKKFFSPSYAHPAKLYGIQSSTDGGWTTEAVDHFFLIVNSKISLFAQIFNLGKPLKDEKLNVKLIDTEGATDVCINDVMSKTKWVTPSVDDADIRKRPVDSSYLNGGTLEKKKEPINNGRGQKMMVEEPGYANWVQRLISDLSKEQGNKHAAVCLLQHSILLLREERSLNICCQMMTQCILNIEKTMSK